MKIDIDKLTENELIDLNNRIVARLKFMHQFRAHSQMLEFSIGDRVCFQPDGHPMLTGMLTRYNKKIVTIITDSGAAMECGPQFLAQSRAACPWVITTRRSASDHKEMNTVTPSPAVILNVEAVEKSFSE